MRASGLPDPATDPSPTYASDDPLHVVFLDSWFPDRSRGSGSAVAISGLAGGLRSLGHQVTVVRPRRGRPTSDLTRIAYNLRLPGRIRGISADLIVGFDFDGCFLARGSIPYVVALKGVIADELRYEAGWNRHRFRILSSLERRNARKADRVIVTSRHSRAVATAAYSLDPDLVRVVPEGIDPGRWASAGAHVSRALHPTIVSVARQYRRKNTTALVRAMPLVLAEVPDARLRIAGDGPEMPRLRRLVASLGLADGTVTLLGSVGESAGIRRELSSADVFCLPSRQEGFGIVFLEAMAAGLPIVAAEAAAVPETAPHGEVSLLVPPDDVEALAGALVRLLRDEDLRSRLTAAGSVRWRRFAWPDVARRFLAEARPG